MPKAKSNTKPIPKPKTAGVKKRVLLHVPPPAADPARDQMFGAAFQAPQPPPGLEDPGGCAVSALAKSRRPFDKPFGEWCCQDITAPAEDACKAIAEIMAFAPAADRNLVLAANVAVLSGLFRNAFARVLIQLAIEAER